MNEMKLVSPKYYWAVKNLAETLQNDSYLGSIGDVHYFKSYQGFGYGAPSRVDYFKFDVNNLDSRWEKVSETKNNDFGIKLLWITPKNPDKVINQLTELLSTLTMD